MSVVIRVVGVRAVYFGPATTGRCGAWNQITARKGDLLRAASSMKGTARSMITRESSPRVFSVIDWPSWFQYRVPYGTASLGSLAGFHQRRPRAVLGFSRGSQVGTFASVEKQTWNPFFPGGEKCRLPRGPRGWSPGSRSSTCRHAICRSAPGRYPRLLNNSASVRSRWGRCPRLAVTIP
ncbi:MAG: hypothetical protein Ct9H300mP1_37510 [Planctomycetaceae bacterium]|nr:MAG: hypothetical protein Ct9H300mP1_37510 [Planctomycetaceae bacterium]